MNYPTIQYGMQDGIVRIKLNRPRDSKRLELEDDGRGQRCSGQAE
jgi:hypothetical protein